MIIGSKIDYHKSIVSTNSLASELIMKSEPPEGTIIYADFQSAGKGQPGNKWESEDAKNLLISIILYPSGVIPEQQFLLAEAISLGICDFLDRYFNGSKIKWPNDIYVRDDKIAGILLENSIMGNTIESSIAGIGLNINQDIFPSGIPNPVSLKMITGKTHDRNICLKELSANLDKRYKQLLYGDTRSMHNDYIRRLYRFEEFHAYKSDQGEFEGKITDVLLSGQLKIQFRGGNNSTFSFREIDFVI